MNSKYVSLYVVLLLTLSCKGQTQEIIIQEPEVEVKSQLFNADALLERVKFLSLDSLEGRRTGEKGGLIAREYVVNQFSQQLKKCVHVE